VATRFNIYCTGHLHSKTICEALRQGTGFPVVSASPLQKGGVAMYGFLRGLLPTLKQARNEHRPWVYLDRGYFRATYGTDYSGYFRMTRNAWQHSGKGGADKARWQRLGLSIEPWKKGGDHILVCPPGDVFTQAVGGFAAEKWLRSTLATLAQHTKREVRVRYKADAVKRTLAQDLDGCHALVTYMSNTAVEALLYGVPVFCTGPSAAQSMGRADLAEIESPVYRDDRERWAEVLAANQWTLDEIRAGVANHIFDEDYA
jgi:hypothetical protein